jgi:hypothetical protein
MHQCFLSVFGLDDVERSPGARCPCSELAIASALKDPKHGVSCKLNRAREFRNKSQHRSFQSGGAIFRPVFRFPAAAANLS